MKTPPMFIPVQTDVVKPVLFDARIRVCRVCGQSRAGHAVAIHEWL